MTGPTGDARGESIDELAHAWEIASQPARAGAEPAETELDWIPPQDDTAPAAWLDLAALDMHADLAEGTATDACWSLGVDRPPEPACGADHAQWHTAHQCTPAGMAAGPGEKQCRAFPQIGELLSGFRIVCELGRGAFARVYLAQQADLANRQVALKVSQAQSDEPQMLARLQHTHIVPIHSVHDDLATGLRLLCMPYLGGANLAQVLDRAGAHLPLQVTGRSVVEALDQLGHNLSSPETDSRKSACNARPSTLAWTGSSDTNGATAPRGIGSLSTARSIWNRCCARMPWSNRVELDPISRDQEAAEGEAELAHPARRFLRKASYIQAVVWITARLAEGLDHAHTRGLLHRDLKPSNILIAADGTPMLLDFNLAADAKQLAPEDGAKALIGGTLPYMAPEHLDAFNPRGATLSKAVDERSDIYALGLILFEMIAGTHPFSEPPSWPRLTDVLRFMTAERRRGAPSLKTANPQVTWGLDAILKKCLEPEPNRRYQRARDLAEDLRRYLDDVPLKYTPEPSLRERAAKWARRNPRVSSATSIALVAAGLIVAIGGVLSFVADTLQAASARLQRGAFQTTFDECQLLLNTISGPPEHLSRGISRARRALQGYGIGQNERWTDGPLVRRLPPADQATLREEASELVLLVARARVVLAERSGSERERQRALQWAIAWLEHAEAFDPRPSAALYGDRAQYRAALGLADEAARDRALQARTAPATSRDFYLLGTSALSQGQTERAEGHLLHSVALDPRRFWAWFALGMCHSDQGRYLEAAGDFSVCTALVPAFGWPHLNRGLALARAGRLLDARAAYDRALAANPRFIEALVNRGLACLELDDLVQAERDFDKVIALGRRDVSLLAARAEIEARLGHRDVAQRDYLELLRLHPKEPALLVAYGFFLLSEPSADGQTHAKSEFDRALALDPRNVRAHLGLAHLCRRTDIRAALAEVNLALDVDPSLADALQLRALLRARLGDRGALADVERLIHAPTPHRLYNAACALALLARTDQDPTLVSRSLDLLHRALDTGFPAPRLAEDPDLEVLRNRVEFKNMTQAAAIRRR